MSPLSRRTPPSRLIALALGALAIPALLTVPAAMALTTSTPTTSTPTTSTPTTGPPTTSPPTTSPPGPERGSTCARPDVLFCENFNHLRVGPASSRNWTVDTQQGSLSIEPLRPGSRDRVLHAHTVGNGRALLTIPNFQAPHNSYFGRMWVTVDAFPTAPDFAHFIMVQATGGGSTEMVRPVGGQFINTKFLKQGGSGRSLLGIGADGGPTGDWTNWKESATAASGAWQCIEWTMQARTNKVQLWVNGMANPDLVVSTNNHGGNPVPFILPKVNKLQIGWWLFQAGPTPDHFDLRYDNIALSSHRLGCGRAPSTH